MACIRYNSDDNYGVRIIDIYKTIVKYYLSYHVRFYIYLWTFFE